MRTVTEIRAMPSLRGQRIDLSWQNPLVSEFESGVPLTQICIMRQERTFPLVPDPAQSVYYGPVISEYSDRTLKPLTTYYYTLFTQDSNNEFYADEHSRFAAFATADYGLTERLYKLLPAVHLRYDLPLTAAEVNRLSPPIQTALQTLPPGLRDRGQLWRFFVATASSLDLMRSLAEGLRQLHDLDRVRPEFLPFLAQWVGWEPDYTLPIFSQRNEIKAAPQLYRSVGTVPHLRSLVTRYTGWYTQVAEFAQSITRSNVPAQFNLFALQQSGSTWRGTDDAALVLGFGAGNDTATGSDSPPATAARLVSTNAAPFRLRPGMELAITADDRIPVSIRFESGDFADIRNATAAEIVATLNRTLSEVSAIAQPDGRIAVRSHLLGVRSSLRVEQYATSLVTLEGAPKGRLSAFKDQSDRLRLFYETADPQAPVTDVAALQSLKGISLAGGIVAGEAALGSTAAIGTAPTVLPSQPQGRIRYKTFRNGSWGDSYPLIANTPIAQADPAVVELPDGRLWIAWIDNPNTADSRLRFSRSGTVKTSQPARLLGQRSQPFAVAPGSRLVLRGNWAQPEGIEFTASDFPSPGAVTAAQLVTVLNARLDHVIAAVDAANPTVINLRTIASGGDEYLELDLGLSNAATAIGFDARNALAQGEWGDGIDWAEPEDIAGISAGRHAELQAIVDNTGTVWLFWATFVNATATWQIVSARWNGTTWSPPEILAQGLGGNREPVAVLDATNRIWLFWARRQGVGTPEDIWTLKQRVFTSGSGWSPETAVTTPPATGRFADREPAAIRLPDNTLQVFYQSDRAGGSDLWSVIVTPTADPTTSPVGVPTVVTTGAAADRAPIPLRQADGTTWLLYRSDRSVPLSRINTRPFPSPDNRITSPKAPIVTQRLGRSPSIRSPDTGTLQHFAGTTSVISADRTRLERRRQWDDLQTYTPQKPMGAEFEAVLQDDERYTRGTVGLYLSQIISEDPLTPQRVERLRPLLERFLPLNVRAVVILAPRADVEFVYRPGADLQDAYLDQYPIPEYYTGLADSTIVALPDWSLLRSNQATDVTANPANLTTLRRRTYFPPPT